ncbi:MAG: SDR family oxidoreductase [Acidobacteriota bacterium]|nr:SDR family oxidoreductase [Acidobacteriota bacterium]
MILLSGATGTIGSRIRKILSDAGQEVRCLVRQPLAEHNGSDANVEYVAADLARRETLHPAFAGIDTLFLLTPVAPNQLDMERNLLEAAVSQHVRRIVKLSVLGAAPDSEMTFGRIHGQMEQQIRTSGCQWTFLRPNMLMQNLFWYRDALRNGVLSLPLGTAAVSHIDAEDVAAVASEALIHEGHSGRIYELTGPRSITGDETVAILSAQLGKSIRYEPISLSTFREELQKRGDPDFVANAEYELFDLWSRGAGDVVTNNVPQITGHEATNLAHFAERERERLI